MRNQKGSKFIGIFLTLMLCIGIGRPIYVADGVELTLLKDNYDKYDASFQAI